MVLIIIIAGHQRRNEETTFKNYSNCILITLLAFDQFTKTWENMHLPSVA